MTAPGLVSWGRYPPRPQEFTNSLWRHELPAVLSDFISRHGTTLPYGGGRSYGDSCLAASDHVIRMRTLDRFISADWHSGLLVAEAGVTLEQILLCAIPRGWFLSVTPGTKHATLGGAIANDVHGKNHHRRGTFGCHVVDLGLFRSDAGRITCSADKRPDLFAATIGGLGLTGVIEWARIQLVPIRSSQLMSVSQRFGSLDEFFDLSAELDTRHEHCASWVDCLARGSSLGRGVYSAADFAAEGDLKVAQPKKRTVPFTPPVPLFNRVSLPAFNAVYWRKAPVGRTTRRIGYDPFLYPLDGVHEWNRLYGPKGFQQYQCIVPPQYARDAIRALLGAIAGSASGSFLAVLKRCGGAVSPGLMSFPCEGTSLALDFPQSDELDADLFPRLDAIVREARGRLYPAKDAHMQGEDFRSWYPGWINVEAMRDPALLSHFWRRVTQ